MKLSRKKAKARVEMAPLLDIVFLLLVFFIYAMLSMAAHRALPLNLPSSRTADLDMSAGLAIMVRADGILLLDREPVLLDELALLLELKKNLEPDPESLTVQVFAEDSLSYQALYRVLDQISLAGIRRISLQAGPEKDP